MFDRYDMRGPPNDVSTIAARIDAEMILLVAAAQASVMLKQVMPSAALSLVQSCLGSWTAMRSCHCPASGFSRCRHRDRTAR